MKSKILALGGLVAVMGLGTAYTLKAQTPPAPTPPIGAKMRGDKHPEIRKAMHALENAKTALKSAAHDYDGHRAKALEMVDSALGECREALKVN